MLSRLFFDVDREGAKNLLKSDESPGFILRRTSDESNDKLLFIIDADNPEDHEKITPYYYAASYVFKDTLRHFKFKSFEHDPEKLSDKFSAYFTKNHPSIAAIIEKAQRNHATTKFISMHRDAKLRPEEVLFAKNILTSQKGGAVILSTQTPSKDPKKLEEKKSAGGKTGLEIQRILSQAEMKDKWVIITGHGEVAGEEVIGTYHLWGKELVKTDLNLSPEDYCNMLLQAGLSAGDTINILLCVCYGGTSGDFDDEPSFAEKLGKALASHGIQSNIIASTSKVGRFTGRYFEDETPGTSLRFRVKGGPENIRQFTTTIANKKVTTRLKDDFTEDLFISTQGVGFQHPSEPKKPKKDK